MRQGSELTRNFRWFPVGMMWSSFVFTGGDASGEDSSPTYRVL